MSKQEFTDSKYSAFKKTMKAAKEKADAKELQSIKRTISNPLPSEGPKVFTGFVPGQTPSSKGGRKRKTKRRKRRRKSRGGLKGFNLRSVNPLKKTFNKRKGEECIPNPVAIDNVGAMTQCGTYTPDPNDPTYKQQLQCLSKKVGPFSLPKFTCQDPRYRIGGKRRRKTQKRRRKKTKKRRRKKRTKRRK